MTDHIAEIVTFRAVAGTTPAAMTAAAAGLEAWIAAQPGFVARQLSRTEDGTWTDHVTWRDLAAAEAAAAALESAPGAGAFMALIDPASVVMSHGRIVVEQAAR